MKYIYIYIYLSILNNIHIKHILITDKECPLYSQAMSVVMANNSPSTSAPDALALVQQMREDGLALKK